VGIPSIIFGNIGIGVGCVFGLFAYVSTTIETPIDITPHFLIIAVLGIGGGSALPVKNYNQIRYCWSIELVFYLKMI